jgi:hypothetical protein
VWRGCPEWGYPDTCWQSVAWVMWDVVTGVEGYPVEGSHDTHWLMGLWSTQAKVEGIVLKAAWH